MRRTIRDMPYRRRHEGLTVGEIYVLKQILRFIPDLIEMSGNLPECPLKAFCQLLLYALFVILLAQLIVERHDVVPINHENKNRLISSFTDELLCLRTERFGMSVYFRVNAIFAVQVSTSNR